MFPKSARRRAGTLAILGTAVALAAPAPPASAVVPTFERSLHAAGKRPAAAAVGRLDGDAHADVLVATRTDEDLAFFRGLGGGALTPAERLPLWPGAYGADLELGDFDGDGDRDAVGGIGGALTVLENDGAGGFARTQSVTMHRPVGNVAVGDLNGDGLADVVASYTYTMGDIADAGVLVFLGRAGTDEPLRQIAHEPLTASILAMAVEDVDGDGHEDLMYGERFRVGPHWDAGATDGVVIRFGDGTGALGPRVLHDAGDAMLTNHPQHVDLTGDGVEDLVAVHSNSSTFTTWPGAGAGEFGAPVTRFLSTQLGEVDSGDFDQDGKPDLVTAAGYELRVFYGFDGTRFDSFALPANAPYNYDVTVADVDGDGRDDIVSSSYGEDVLAGDFIAVHRNTTTVAPPPPPPPPPAKQCEDGKDNDGDGRVDTADAGCSSAIDDDESDDPAPPPPPPPPPAIPFAGFFAPVNNLPTLNMVNAGRAIPVKFSLGGDRGLDVFAAGYPRSQEIACDTSLEVDGIEETVTAGGSSLAYDAAADRYQYVWKSSEAWAGTCRQLVVKLRDGSTHRAAFRFR